jgi:hypothetical protein
VGIEIADAIQQPEVAYNRVFLRRLLIDQTEVAEDAPPPHYTVFIEYRLYGVRDGTRVYHHEIREIELSDFLLEAIRQAGAGNTTLVNALPTIEAAIAALIEADRNTTAQVV